MKKLLLLTLVIIPLVGIGQTNFDSDGFIISPLNSILYEPDTLRPGDDEFTKYVINQEMSGLIYLLDTYYQECYNDSAGTKYAILKGGVDFIFRKGEWLWEKEIYLDAVKNGYFDEFINGKYLRDTITYMHKKPTFKGFYEWIKNKQK